MTEPVHKQSLPIGLSLPAPQRSLRRKTAPNLKPNLRKRVKQDVKEVNMYPVRKEICEGNDVHCLAFTVPLMDLGQDHNESDQEASDSMGVTSIIAAK